MLVCCVQRFTQTALWQTAPACLPYSLQIPAISTALDALETGLSLPSRGAALSLLCRQPALLYDLTPASIADRLEAMATAFQVGSWESGPRHHTSGADIRM
jgi:hypothetical protein